MQKTVYIIMTCEALDTNTMGTSDSVKKTKTMDTSEVTGLQPRNKEILVIKV